VEYAVEILNDLSARRAHIVSQGPRDGMQVINSHVPLAEMFGYGTYLHSETRGRASFTMHLATYRAFDPPENDDADTSGVRAPCNPAPTLRDSSIALPEPEDDIGK
jgi:translation elongation factor EF-G